MNEPRYGRGEDSRPLTAFRTVPAYVLLGDPGSGKSTSFDSERTALGDEACLVTARDFLAFDPDVHPEWRARTLFIDGLDEVRAGSADARTPLDELRRRLDSLGRPRFRLSCREADWLGPNDRANLARVTPDAGLTVLRLDPLTEDDIERILNAHSGIDDVPSFMATAREKGSRRIPRQSSVSWHAGRRGDKGWRLAGEPSGALRAGLAGWRSASRTRNTGRSGQRPTVTTPEDDLWTPPEGCVRSFSSRRRRFRDSAGAGGCRLPPSGPVRARLPGTVSPCRFHEAVHSRGGGPISGGASSSRRVPRRQVSRAAHRRGEAIRPTSS